MENSFDTTVFITKFTVFIMLRLRLLTASDCTIATIANVKAIHRIEMKIWESMSRCIIKMTNSRWNDLWDAKLKCYCMCYLWNRYIYMQILKCFIYKTICLQWLTKYIDNRSNNTLCFCVVSYGSAWKYVDAELGWLNWQFHSVIILYNAANLLIATTGREAEVSW